MSGSGSRPLGQRRAADRYPTPAPLARYLVGLLPELALSGRVLEPSCGAGAWLEAVWSTGWRGELLGVDIEPDPSVDLVADFLRDEIPDGWDLVLGNPPYSLAEPFVRRSLELVKVGGLVAFLLRLSFLESRKRLPLWSEHRLDRVHVLAERPSFTEDGRSDSAAYALFVWRRMAPHVQLMPHCPTALTVHSWRHNAR